MFWRSRSRRRREMLTEPFPESWLPYLHQNVALYKYLSDREQQTLRDDLRILIAEKNWEGCGGLMLSDEITVTIAAHACLLLLGLEHNFYPNVESILIYPAGFLPRRLKGIGEIVTESRPLGGEAWSQGPVVLSWSDARAGGRHPEDGVNNVLHEFAHKLDMLDGACDGIPPLADEPQFRRWTQIITAEYERLVAQSEQGQATLLRAYGAQDKTEFFAVATEGFFMKPCEMRHEHQELYDVLCSYYKQYPATRVEAYEKAHSPQH